MTDRNNEIKIEIKVDEEIATGIFCNFTNISHSPEEVVMDFIFVHPAPPPGFGKLMSRIIVSPGHAKRLMLALQQNLAQYEEKYGAVQGVRDPGSPGPLQ
jgi:hypothetical protein